MKLINWLERVDLWLEKSYPFRLPLWGILPSSILGVFLLWRLLVRLLSGGLHQMSVVSLCSLLLVIRLLLFHHLPFHDFWCTLQVLVVHSNTESFLPSRITNGRLVSREGGRNYGLGVKESRPLLETRISLRSGHLI